MLHDSAEIQTYETEIINKKRESKGLSLYTPLYNSEDVKKCLLQFETAEYNTWFTVMNGVDVLFTPAGHIVGSAAITIRIKELRKKTTILYSGDIGRYHSLLLQPPAEAPKLIILFWKVHTEINIMIYILIQLKF